MDTIHELEKSLIRDRVHRLFDRIKQIVGPDYNDNHKFKLINIRKIIKIIQESPLHKLEPEYTTLAEDLKKAARNKKKK